MVEAAVQIIEESVKEPSMRALRRLRENLNLSLREAEKASGVKYSTINQFEVKDLPMIKQALRYFLWLMKRNRLSKAEMVTLLEEIAAED